jgi:hypothetical protein
MIDVPAANTPVSLAKNLTTDDIEDLCANEWATRIWTVQEYVLGFNRTTVVCSKFRTPVDNFIEWVAFVGSTVLLAPQVDAHTASRIQYGWHRYWTRRTGAVS